MSQGSEFTDAVGRFQFFQILIKSVGVKRSPRDSATVFCIAKKSRRVNLARRETKTIFYSVS